MRPDWEVKTYQANKNAKQKAEEMPGCDGLSEDIFGAAPIMSTTIQRGEVLMSAGYVKGNYEDGVCPDCGESIPRDATEGEECAHCGFVFNPVAESE